MNDSLENYQSKVYIRKANGGLFLTDCSSVSMSEVTLFTYIQSTIQTLLMFTAIFMNITIIVVVFCTKRLHTVPHVFISSLACSDLMTSCIIFVSMCILISSLIAHKTCDLQPSQICLKVFLTFFSVTANIFNHLMISIERWLYIARPFLHQRIVNPRTSTACLISVWVISCAFNLNLLIDQCGAVKFSTRINNGAVKPALSFFLSLFMCVIYTHITCITYRQVKIINQTKLVYGVTEDQTVWKTRNLWTRKWTTIRMLVIVFGTYFLSVTPSFCADVYAYARDQNVYDTLACKIINLIWSVHCCFNFCLYATQDRVFRNVLKERLQKMSCVFCRAKVHPDASN